MKSNIIGIAVLLGGFCAPLHAEEKWTSLFDGKSLDGWKAAENPDAFKVQNGCIVADGPKAHLFFIGDGVASADFRNFEFEAEAKAAAGANSGVYFHTAFQEKDFPTQGNEVQINNSVSDQGHGYFELKKTGSLYGVRNLYRQIVADDEWFKIRIEVRSKHVKTWINEILTVDYVEPSNPESIAHSGNDRTLGHGTFALQCHEPGQRVEFHNIRARRLPDRIPTDAIPAKYDELDQRIVGMSRENFPLIDFHVHLKGGLTLDEALARSRRLGINYGIAFNCGLGFPVTNDQGIDAVIESVKGAPVFVGMQAEGREWTKMFSKEAIAKFDYVFTDGMTLTAPNGKRTRLWIPEEVEIDDPEAFMELLVKTTVEIIDHEPIDIYVNPLFLPDVLQPKFDELWTEARFQKVLDALVRNDVALEISNRYGFLKPEWILKAKAAGIKFTLGTNNTDGNFGRENDALNRVKTCGLTWKNMWMPKPDGKKPVQIKGFK